MRTVGAYGGSPVRLDKLGVRRRRAYVFAKAATESRWRAFVRQYADLMQIVLVIAGILSLYPLKELGTGLLLLLLTLLNAVLGLRQEGQAAAAVAALRLDTLSDQTFIKATGVSVVTLILATVFGPLQRFLGTTDLNARQWIICICVALSIVVATEVRRILLERGAVASVAPVEAAAARP